MKKYGKFRKHRKTFRKTYRNHRKTYRKYGKGRSFKRFKRQLNNAAEKKTYNVTGLADLADTFTHSLADDTTTLLSTTGIFANIASNMAEGTDSNEHIGKKIFIRYITIIGRVKCEYGVDAANSYGATCKVSMQIVKDTREGGFSKQIAKRATLYGSDLIAASPGNVYIVRPDKGFKFLKGTKKKRLQYNMFADAKYVSPHLEVSFKKTIKVMKDLSIGTAAGDWSIGGKKIDIYPHYVFEKEWEHQETSGPATQYLCYITYTDV